MLSAGVQSGRPVARREWNCSGPVARVIMEETSLEVELVTQVRGAGCNFLKFQESYPADAIY